MPNHWTEHLKMKSFPEADGKIRLATVSIILRQGRARYFARFACTLLEGKFFTIRTKLAVRTPYSLLGFGFPRIPPHFPHV